jgi:hypothetical protein
MAHEGIEGISHAPPSPAALEANTESFLASLGEPQCGHLVPSHFVERTRISLSRSHFSQ